MLERLRDALRGARQIEIIVMIILIAIAGLFLFSGDISDGSGGTELENRLQKILMHIDGVNRPEVMIAETDTGGIKGVVIVAKGIDDIKTRLYIQNAVKALLDIETSKIEIIERK